MSNACSMCCGSSTGQWIRVIAYRKPKIGDRDVYEERWTSGTVNHKRYWSVHSEHDVLICKSCYKREGAKHRKTTWPVELALLLLELVAKPHRHFFNVIMMQANWKKATNIPI